MKAEIEIKIPGAKILSAEVKNGMCKLYIDEPDEVTKVKKRSV